MKSKKLKKRNSKCLPVKVENHNHLHIAASIANGASIVLTGGRDAALILKHILKADSGGWDFGAKNSYSLKATDIVIECVKRLEANADLFDKEEAKLDKEYSLLPLNLLSNKKPRKNTK